MTSRSFNSQPIQRLFQGRLMGLFFCIAAIFLSLMMAAVLMDYSDLTGIKIAFIAFIAGTALMWCLTTEKIPTAMLGLVFFLGTCEGYLKIMSSGSMYYVAYAIRNILIGALILNILIKIYSRKLESAGFEFSWPPFSLIIGFYTLWCLINIFHPDSINLLNSVAGVKVHIEFIPLYFLGFMVCRKEPQWYVHLLITFVIIGVLNSVAAIHQYRIGPEALPQVWGSGYERLVSNEANREAQTIRDQATMKGRVYFDDNYNIQLRPPGLGSDHTYPAMIAQIAVFSAVVLLFYYLKTRNYWLLGCLAASGFILFAGIVVSASRSYLLLTIVGVSLCLLFYTREIFSGQKLKIIVLLIIAATVMGGNYALRSYLSENVYDRFENVSTPEKLLQRLEGEKFSNWDYTKRYLLEHPLGRGLGKVGPGSAFFATSTEEALALGNGETEFNFFLSELGIVGLVLFYIIVIGTLLKSITIMRNSAPDSYQRLSSMVVFLYLLTFVLNSPLGTGATFPQKASIWLLMGCFWALHNRPERFFLPTKLRQW